jgi:hypothetical protein
VPRREPEALLKQARAAIDDMVSRDAQAITAHPSVTSREVFLRYRRMPFARWDDGKLYFGWRVKN